MNYYRMYIWCICSYMGDTSFRIMYVCSKSHSIHVTFDDNMIPTSLLDGGHYVNDHQPSQLAADEYKLYPMDIMFLIRYSSFHLVFLSQ